MHTWQRVFIHASLQCKFFLFSHILYICRIVYLCVSYVQKMFVLYVVCMLILRFQKLSQGQASMKLSGSVTIMQHVQTLILSNDSLSVLSFVLLTMKSNISLQLVSNIIYIGLKSNRNLAIQLHTDNLLYGSFSYKWLCT